MNSYGIGVISQLNCSLRKIILLTFDQLGVGGGHQISEYNLVKLLYQQFVHVCGSSSMNSTRQDSVAL